MATVTIAKSYFEALLRRGEFHTNGTDNLSPPDCITITQAEYRHLNKLGREYAILRDALLRGGLDQSTLDLLISEESTQRKQDEGLSCDHAIFARPNSIPVSITKPANHEPTPDASKHVSNLLPSQLNNCGKGMYTRSYSFGGAESLASGFEKEDGYIADNAANTNGDWRAGMLNNEQRTLLFTNLPEKTTHAELTSIVKGGILLDIHVRHDRTATVSFVDGAKEFLNYAKKSDIYLRTKRIEVQWNDRSFRMPAHVANKIHAGASRNIVVRNGMSRELTEQGIRDDLEHIHNLVVISVHTNTKTGDIFISTNSVHNALFARTCMMSRALYKSLKIEYSPDECNVPIPKLPERVTNVDHAVKPKAHIKSSISRVPGNLYALLAEDGANDESDGSENTSEEQAMPGFAERGVKFDWADSVAVA